MHLTALRARMPRGNSNRHNLQEFPRSAEAISVNELTTRLNTIFAMGSFVSTKIVFSDWWYVDSGVSRIETYEL
jgi:hypothetical protein